MTSGGESRSRRRRLVLPVLGVCATVLFFLPLGHWDPYRPDPTRVRSTRGCDVVRPRVVSALAGTRWRGTEGTIPRDPTFEGERLAPSVSDKTCSYRPSSCAALGHGRARLLVAQVITLRNPGDARTRYEVGRLARGGGADPDFTGFHQVDRTVDPAYVATLRHQETQMATVHRHWVVFVRIQWCGATSGWPAPADDLSLLRSVVRWPQG